jgi:hypothetical protein
MSISPHPGVLPGVGKALVIELPRRPSDRINLKETMMSNWDFSFQRTDLNLNERNELMALSIEVQERKKSTYLYQPSNQLLKGSEIKTWA